MYNRTLEMWTQCLIEMFPMASDNDSVSDGAPSHTLSKKISLSRNGSFSNLSRNGSFSNLRNASSLCKKDSMMLSVKQTTLKCFKEDSKQSLTRAPSTESQANSMMSADDSTEHSKQITDSVCQACFKLASLKNSRELFLHLAIRGWTMLRSVVVDESAQVQAALDLQLGFAHLEVLKIVKGRDNFKDERLCIKGFQSAIDLLQDSSYAFQRSATWYGLAQAYKFRREGDRKQNLLRSIDCLLKTLEVCTFEMDPSRCNDLHREIGDMYIVLGQTEEANKFFEIALKQLDEPSSSWNTPSGIKFTRAKTHCKIAEACSKANDMSRDILDREHDSKFRISIEKGIRHYEMALEVFTSRLYPFEYARTYVNMCHLLSIAATKQILHKNGIICLYQGQRTTLMTAYQGFQDALTIAEAMSIVIIAADGNESPTIADDIFITLNNCFSGCIQTSVRLGMYAQALDYSERARGYAVTRALLQEPCRIDLLKGLPEHLQSRFKSFSKKLQKHHKVLTFDALSSGSFAMLHDAVQMMKVLYEMAAYAEISCNKKLKLLQLSMPKVNGSPYVWLEDPVQDNETAVLEFYLSENCAYAFIKCWQESCPRTVEYTPDQIKKIVASVAAVELPEVAVSLDIATKTSSVPLPPSLQKT
jgi:tetratricopeptide (TPR) repeat protein